MWRHYQWVTLGVIGLADSGKQDREPKGIGEVLFAPHAYAFTGGIRPTFSEEKSIYSFRINDQPAKLEQGQKWCETKPGFCETL